MRQSAWRVLAVCAVALAAVAGACQEYTAAQDQRHAVALFAERKDLFREIAVRYEALPEVESLGFNRDTLLWNGLPLAGANTPSSASPMRADDQAWWRKTATDLGIIAIVTTGRRLPQQAQYETFYLDDPKMPHRGFIFAAPGHDYAYARLAGEATRSTQSRVPSRYARLVDLGGGWFYFEQNSIDAVDRILLEKFHGHPRADEHGR